ncbi:MAG: hypothetical protein LBV67_08280 [Streptococcaceae bacterium]|jgi:hypothetical protein|nr:hypothetical protein [Streptococcaceae bacterium]
MDFENINDDEVKQLIDALKKPTKKFELQKIYDSIQSLPVGNLKSNHAVIDEDNDISYILHQYRGRIGDRYSIHLRFKENNEHLIRVDINPPKHQNPNGEIINENHLHIYSNKYDKRDAVAIPLSPSEFPNVSEIIKVVTAFMTKTNIVERK